MKKNPGRKERRRQAKHNRTALSGLKMWFNEMMMKKRNKIARNRERHDKRTVIHEIDGTTFVV